MLSSSAVSVAILKPIKEQKIYVTVTVLPEVDYLATKYLGERVARTFLEDINQDNFALLPVAII